MPLYRRKGIVGEVPLQGGKESIIPYQFTQHMNHLPSFGIAVVVEHILPVFIFKMDQGVLHIFSLSKVIVPI